MMVVVRLQIMRIMGVIVRLESVFRVLVPMQIVAAMLVWVGMLMNMRMGMLMGVLVRVRDSAMAMLMAMTVQMWMVVTVTVFVVSVHRSHPS